VPQPEEAARPYEGYQPQAGGKWPMVSLALWAARPSCRRFVAALATGGRLAHLLYGRHQQANQHRDDGDHHQQFDQRETPDGSTGAAKHVGLLSPTREREAG
jgi:hypothetical protein